MKSKMILCVWIFIFNQLGAQTIINDIDHRLIVEVGYNTTTTLVFNSPIESADYGSGDLLAKPLAKDPRIIKLKAARKDFDPTNITILTAEGHLFSIPVLYCEHPSKLIYSSGAFFTIPQSGVSLPGEKYNSDLQTETFAQCLSKIAIRSKYKPSVKKNGLKLSLDKILYFNNQLFFRFTINNTSNIPYNIHLIRFHIRDRTRSKKTSYSEKQILPHHQHFPDSTIANQSSFVIAFNKFTISDNKYLTLDLSEQNGDRTLKLNISAKQILHCPKIN